MFPSFLTWIIEKIEQFISAGKIDKLISLKLIIHMEESYSIVEILFKFFFLNVPIKQDFGPSFRLRIVNCHFPKNTHSHNELVLYANF